MTRLAIIITHPVQYYSPVFRLLAKRIEALKVFYTWEQAQQDKFDRGFGKKIEWDIPLLEGYEYTFVRNKSSDPGLHHFKGIDNPSLIGEIKEWQATKILIYGWNYKSHLNALRYFKKRVPVYFRGDSTLIDEKTGFKKIIRRIFLTWVYSHVDFAFYVGTHNRNYFLAHGLKQEQLIFAPHAIDNERFKRFSDKRIAEAREWRSRLGIPEKATVFGFIGKLEKKKDPEILIEVFTKLSGFNCHLIFVGNGVEEPVLKKKARESLCIHFIDFQNQSLMPTVYRLADVFVLPSRGPGETWGLAVNEAMACAKPVIVSDKVGCAVDLIKEGQNGFVFKAGNDEQLLKILSNLLTFGKERQSEMGNYSLMIIDEWSLDKSTDRLANGIHRR